MSTDKVEYKGPRVIGAGLPRTGTTSLQAALQTLGYGPCHHFKTHIVDDPWPYTHTHLWCRALRLTQPRDKPARQAILRQIFETKRLDSAVDYPTSAFIEDLVEMYPDAKFIHGTRPSSQKWKQSFDDTIGAIYSPSNRLFMALVPKFAWCLAPVMAAFDVKTLHDHGVRLTGEDNEVIFDGHNGMVKRVVPEGRVLRDFQPTMGWEPLCEFLGVEVPVDERGERLEYPRLNETGEMTKKGNVLKFVGAAYWVVAIGMGYAVVRYAVPAVRKVLEV